LNRTSNLASEIKVRFLATVFRDQPSGPCLLARWSFHTPRREIGSGKPAGGPPPE
jgi:hypothetical protein